MRALKSSRQSSRPGLPSRPSRGRSTFFILLYLEKQVDPELLKQITAKANLIEKTFNGYRARVNGRKITDSEVRKVLKESRTPPFARPCGKGARGSVRSSSPT